MKKVFFATRARGFLNHVFKCNEIEFNFIIDNKNIYELNNQKRKILSWIGRSPVFDWLGIIQRINAKNKLGIINGSFNRFLKSDKPYFIYLENPTALYHYKLNRKKSLLGKSNINRYLNDTNLKAIICMSEACCDTFEQVCGNFEGQKKVIYPYVPSNGYVNELQISQRAASSDINLLFISQGIRFLSKGGLEVIDAFKLLCLERDNINLTIVTSIKDVDEKLIDEIREIPKVRLLDFQLSYEEMEDLYSKSSILLQPTSDESFGLTILEGMKAGLPVIATRLYAIPEMVKDGENGFLTNPHWWFFDKNNIPNSKVWNHREQTLYSGKKNDELIQFLYQKISFLDDHRDILNRMSLKSYEIANSSPFSKESIIQSWNSTLKSIENSQ
ncbi:glycosyltransferase family 4 protein [Cytobacillus gottheilii]|uniref:Glycosyltransferase n=1 Tax=Cytobacillus gottheilii TaxID=859144 RepID=A0ABX8FAV7_9BACI|nr:glycosyltransferase family 4 protein [Cytobacillus gottheilii]QVY61294.1 glycosyltransferase [Cytobacillus gottheilii]